MDVSHQFDGEGGLARDAAGCGDYRVRAQTAMKLGCRPVAVGCEDEHRAAVSPSLHCMQSPASRPAALAATLTRQHVDGLRVQVVARPASQRQQRWYEKRLQAARGKLGVAGGERRGAKRRAAARVYTRTCGPVHTRSWTQPRRPCPCLQSTPCCSQKKAPHDFSSCRLGVARRLLSKTHPAGLHAVVVCVLLNCTRAAWKG